MKKLFASSLLTAVAVPFLMAAPAAKKVQNSTDTTMNSTAKHTHKKKVKKNSKGTTESATTATSTK
jgi:hypothetical protein